MIPSLTSSFLSYNLSSQEVREGSKFTLQQRAVIQNMIADIAEEKITLSFDPEHPLVFQQREAELTGQIGILKYLLDLEASLPQLNTEN